MEFLESVLFAIINFFRNPPFLLGFIAIVGLALQKKRIDEILKGGFLAAFGMFIIQIGVDVLVGAILPLNILYQGIYGDPDAAGMGVSAFTETYGADVGLAMIVAFVIHILIARFTKIKTIFLTGHFLWWMPFIFVAIGVGAGFTGFGLIIWGAILSALYWSFMPWFLRPFVRDVIGDDSFTLGHPSGFLALVSGGIARLVGNKEKSTEDLNLPKGLSFFREVSISGAFVITIAFIISGLILGGYADADQTLIPYSIMQGLQFGVGLIILLQGVRMLVNEIIPAFQGISEKVVPGAQPAYDCPLLFTYKPNAVLIGFVIAMIISTTLIILANSFNLFGVMLIPLIITSFFECGTASVIAEGQGGLRGAVIGTAASAIVMVVLLGLSLHYFAPTIQDWMLIFGGNDMSLWGIVTGFIANLFG
ncbi:MAG: PTS ascorbate transporter subunit IIC [Candidatus Izemoplasmataceae bacterium]|jgi:ascorbate PTS system EIIC component|uniref:PTS ascorbate transporter subunit IIC n=1 Tax=Liberiplasma polymorphum TaxID=3374570 RepID=UPI003772E125